PAGVVTPGCRLRYLSRKWGSADGGRFARHVFRLGQYPRARWRYWPRRKDGSLLPPARRARSRRGYLVFLGRLRADQIAHEIVPATAHHVIRRRSVAVMHVRDDYLVEVLVRLDERIHYEHRVGRWNVVVHRSVREQQMSLEVLRHTLVRFLSVVIGTVGVLHQQALITLTPIVFVITLVVIARLGDPDLEEIRIAEHRVGSGEAATRVSVDSRTIDVDPRIT